MFQDFKSDGVMFCIALGVLLFVIAQSVFFMLRAVKRGKQLGITSDQIKSTVVSSALFSIAPAISIAVTVLVLSVALGYVLPWIRLSVIGPRRRPPLRLPVFPAVSAPTLPTRRSSPPLRGSCRWAAFCR